MLVLPPGFTYSPLRDDDVDDVIDLARFCELHDSGEAHTMRADLVGDLDQIDRDHDALVVRDATGRVIAWAQILRLRTRYADVHPDVRGRGIGAALVAWSVRRAGELGATRIGQTIDDRREDARALFLRSGAQSVHTSWVLRKDLEATGATPPPGSPVPAGVRLRSATPADYGEALDLMELAFSTWPDRPPSDRSVWQAAVTERADYSDDLFVLAGTVVDGRPTVVGAMFLLPDQDVLWVDKLATHPDFQGRGIGRAMVEHSFGLAAQQGMSALCLSTDSRTGALPFYERLGMVVTSSFTHWAIPIGPSREAPTPVVGSTDGASDVGA